MPHTKAYPRQLYGKGKERGVCQVRFYAPGLDAIYPLRFTFSSLTTYCFELIDKSRQIIDKCDVVP